MTQLVISQETVQNVEKDIQLLLSQSQQLVIQDEGQFQEAADFLTKVKVRVKRLDTLKESLTRPFADALKDARNKFKMLSEPYENMEFTIKTKMNEYIRVREEKARREAEEARKKAEEENARLLAEQEAAKAKGEEVKELEPVEAAPVEAPKIQARTEAGMVYTQKRWAVKVIDESQVPREWLCIDQKKVNEAIKTGVREIPGLEIFEESTVSVRT